MKKSKLFVVFTLLSFLTSTVSPSLIYANEVSHIQRIKSQQFSINEEKLVQDILKDIKKESLPELSLHRPIYQTRGAVGLLKALIAKYGITYVSQRLPRIIYKHIAKYVGRRLSEATFVRIFGNIVNWGTGAVVEQLLARALQQAGLDVGTANTVASVVVTVAWWFV